MLHHRRVTLAVYFEHIIPPKPRICIILERMKKRETKECKTENNSFGKEKFRKIHPKTEAKFRKIKIRNSKKKIGKSDQKKSGIEPTSRPIGPTPAKLFRPTHFGDAGALRAARSVHSRARFRPLGPDPILRRYLGFVPAVQT